MSLSLCARVITGTREPLGLVCVCDLANWLLGGGARLPLCSTSAQWCVQCECSAVRVRMARCLASALSHSRCIGEARHWIFFVCSTLMCLLTMCRSSLVRVRCCARPCAPVLACGQSRVACFHLALRVACRDRTPDTAPSRSDSTRSGQRPSRTPSHSSTRHDCGLRSPSEFSLYDRIWPLV